jgi:hypothetical protein
MSGFKLLFLARAYLHAPMKKKCNNQLYIISYRSSSYIYIYMVCACPKKKT